MRRIALLLSCLLLFLSGCKRVAAPEETSAPMETSSETFQVQITLISTGYVESKFLTNVPHQAQGLALGVRSDGTVDYIFSQSQLELFSGKTILCSSDSLRTAGLQYYTITPEGLWTKQPTDWLNLIINAMEAACESGSQEDTWRVSFSASEGTILICTQLQTSFSPSGIAYTALYCLRDGNLTQIPFRWDEKYGGISAAPDGFLAWYDLVGKYHIDGAVQPIFDLFSLDGSSHEPVSVEISDSIDLCLGVGSSTIWWGGKNLTVFAVDTATGEVTASYDQPDERPINAAPSPDGTALYVLSAEPYRNWATLQIVTEDGCEPLLWGSRFMMMDRSNSVPLMAASNDGIVYAAVQKDGSAALIQYRQTS